MKKDLSKIQYYEDFQLAIPLGWIAKGTENANKVRIFVLRGGLRMEANPHLKGMKVTRGRTCYSIIKEEFGFRGNKLKVLKQLNEWIEKNINEPFLEPL